MASCTTSLNTSTTGMSSHCPIASITALPVTPTPLCMGNMHLGMRPARMSLRKKSTTWRPIMSVSGVEGLKVRASSGMQHSTTPAIFPGSISRYSVPMRCPTPVRGMGWR